jgi:RND family efflux transporter MFP subunit
MSYRTTYRLIAVIVAALAGTCLAETSTVEAITRPSADVTLKFTSPGFISKVLVKDGDRVKPRQVLVQLDDEAERAKVAQLKAQGEDKIRIDAAKAQLDQKRLDLKKYEEAAKEGTATTMEVEHARLDVVIAELSLKLAKFQQAQDKLKYEEALIRVDRMRLTSPIDGQIESLAIEQGESVDALEEVLRIVKIDPLWVNVAVPMVRARRLKKGDPARVEFPDPSGAAKTITGKIIHIPAEADAASRTLKVRVEVSNPTGRRAAGEHVKVTFGVKAAATVKRQAHTRTARGGGSKVPYSVDRE